MLLPLTLLSCAIWLFLLLVWGNFWRCDQRLDETSALEPLETPPELGYPTIGVVIPARDEAAVIEQSLGSLLGQRYPGTIHIVLVDDQSSDGTGEIAARLVAERASDRDPAAAPNTAPGDERGGDRQLTILPGQPLEPGWTGKLWALKQGIAQFQPKSQPKSQPQEPAPGKPPQYLLLTDADIAHGPDNLQRLVTKAQREQLDLTSLMVQLRCESPWERFLIPAFIFFFQKLYPFPWVNRPGHPMAAAAGGCILIRPEMLEKIGGIDCLRDALIDDCALGAAVKGQGGKLWLGLSQRTISLRPYPSLETIWTMVARTAYTQLYYSPLLLAGTLVGMALVYLMAPLAVVVGAVRADGPLLGAGLATWGLMVVAYGPTLGLYGQSAWAGLGLPAIASLYSLMTLDSARRHWQGKGGQWKGRSYGQ